MKRHLRRTLAALAAPAAGAMVMAAPATATVATTAAPAALRCHASMSNSRPKDYTTIYVNVGTVRYAGVTTVDHYKTVNRKHARTANAGGSAKIGYYISGATPGYRGERERYGHLRQQPRHLRDVVHTAPVTATRGTNRPAR